MLLSPENDSLLVDALGLPVAIALRANRRTVSTPVQISVQELERLLNAARGDPVARMCRFCGEDF